MILRQRGKIETRLAGIGKKLEPRWLRPTWTSGEALVSYQLYLMLPYVLSILAMVLVARKASYPQALMKPYRKGER